MKPVAGPIRIPLHITIGTLFVCTVVLLGIVLGIQSYTHSRDMIFASAEDVHRRISTEMQLQFRATYRPVVGSLKLLALSPVVEADSREQRGESLLLLTRALAEVQAISGIQLGYPNGDYFIVRPVRTDDMKAQFAAPQQAEYMVDDIVEDAGVGRVLYRSFYDDELSLVGVNPPLPTDYDPRSRPWYLAAETKPVAIQPYLFHFIRKVGTTVTLKTGRPGVVIASDVALDQFSETMGRYRITPNSEAAIIRADGRVLAYHDAAQVVEKRGDDAFGLAHIGDLNSAVLTAFGAELDVTPRRLDIEHQGKRWTGSIDRIAERSGLGMNILLLSPVEELLGEAVAIGRESIVGALIIVLLSIPVVWLISTRIARPIRQLAREAEAIRKFDFDASVQTRSAITEVDALADAMRMMKTTINRFLSLINSLAGEKQLDALLNGISRETMRVAEADAAVTFLVDDDETLLRAEAVHISSDGNQSPVALPDIELAGDHPLARCLCDEQVRLMDLQEPIGPGIAELLGPGDNAGGGLLAVPLRNRQGEPVGVLCLLFSATEAVQADEREARIAFVDALSGFSAVSIESRHLLKMQAALLDAFIKLIAGAIDSKSPYTGGHCQRVPELTRMLAEAACESTDACFADFQLDREGWEALHIASWLHDCGKVTTPEYVVDKSTKLETIYDRIHEVRMRFEVLKRDAQIDYWVRLSEGGDPDVLMRERDAELARLDDDFAFVAECNEGGEFMASERLERLRTIGGRTWLRTLDDRLGVSWEEKRRKERVPRADLPVAERLLDDKPEHLIERPESERMPDDNPWGFRLNVPDYLYNRGELYNLGVARGTLSDEERFKINDHVVQTIIMLNKLPYPKHLKSVPEIAGGHHETMDGKGYPKRLRREETSVTARMMAIADIFEALTASDRPYKKPKTLSESISILSFMKDDAHIDPDLFRLFLQSGVWSDYADRFLDPAQVDEVDIDRFLR